MRSQAISMRYTVYAPRWALRLCQTESLFFLTARRISVLLRSYVCCEPKKNQIWYMQKTWWKPWTARDIHGLPLLIKTERANLAGKPKRTNVLRTVCWNLIGWLSESSTMWVNMSGYLPLTWKFSNYGNWMKSIQKKPEEGHPWGGHELDPMTVTIHRSSVSDRSTCTM